LKRPSTRGSTVYLSSHGYPSPASIAVPVGDPISRGDSRLVGMGLYDSFALLAAPASTLSDGFESLFAHELFHYWNGRVLQAAKPDKLVYWFVEGFTEYYALRILYESGYWKPDVYAKWINRHLRQYHDNPAIHASNQAILERYWPERDTVGEVPYQRGVLLGLRWHRLRRKT
jgi:predicted metalloprotease with PDZ domain